jgi:HD-like signal output (HDOD) protein
MTNIREGLMSTATLKEPLAVQEIIKKVSSIATLPEVTAKIVATVEDPKSNAAQLHKIVSNDPALVTRILKVVNSAFYGLPGQIASIERAIVLLGLNAIKNIAVAASLGQLFRGVKLCEGFTARDLWTHCLAVGVAARDMAKQMKIPLVDEAFLAGMIHDVGILISLQTNGDQLREVCAKVKESGGNFCDLERDMIGVDHQELGQALAEHWKFPRSCQMVAGFHHRPMALSLENRLLVTLVYVADTICCTAGQGFNLTALSQKLEDAGLSEIGLDMSVVEHTRTNLGTLVSTAALFA